MTHERKVWGKKKGPKIDQIYCEWGIGNKGQAATSVRPPARSQERHRLKEKDKTKKGQERKDNKKEMCKMYDVDHSSTMVQSKLDLTTTGIQRREHFEEKEKRRGLEGRKEGVRRKSIKEVGNEF